MSRIVTFDPKRGQLRAANFCFPTGFPFFPNLPGSHFHASDSRNSYAIPPGKILVWERQILVMPNRSSIRISLDGSRSQIVRLIALERDSIFIAEQRARN